MALPLWSDAGTDFPPNSPPTSASILGRFLATVPDPNLDWPDASATQNEKTVRQWVSDGINNFFFAVMEGALAAKERVKRDHVYIRQYLTEQTPTALTSGNTYADVTLPADCHLLLDAVLYPTTTHDMLVVEVPAAWDYRVRNFPSHYGPDPKRPLISILSSGVARIYLAGPIQSGTNYALRYVRSPLGVYDTGGGVYKGDVPDQFLDGPLHFARAKWYASREIDPSPYMAEFKRCVATSGALLPAPAADGGQG